MASKVSGNGITWIEKVRIKRNAQASAVGLAQTCDEERAKELIAWLLAHDLVEDPDIKKQTVLEVDYYTGIIEVIRDGKNITRKPINVEGSGYAMDAFEPLLRALTVLAKSQRIVAVIKGAIRESTALNDFINAISYSEEWFSTESTAIVLTPSLTLLPSVVKSRTFIVDVPLSTETERREWVHRAARTYGLVISDTDVDHIVEVVSGLDLTNVQSALIESVITAPNEFRDDILARVKSEAIQRTTNLKVLVNVKHGFERVGGCVYLKDVFQRTVIRRNRNPERSKNFGIKPPKGILLVGSGGTGKTIFAKAVAKECGLPFFEFPIQEFLSSGIVSESERFLAAKLKTIDEAGKCIVFVDEIDAIGGIRGKGGELDGGTSRRCENIFMSWLAEDHEAIVIGTTNRPQDLDRAFRRVGRFDMIVPILLPDDDGRREILRVHTSVVRKIPVQMNESEWAEIVDKTRWWNGAEIERLCLRAAENGEMDESRNYVGAGDFRKALSDMKVNVEERKKEQEQYLKICEEIATEREALQEAAASFGTIVVDRASRAAKKMHREEVKEGDEPTIKL